MTAKKRVRVDQSCRDWCVWHGTISSDWRLPGAHRLEHGQLAYRVSLRVPFDDKPLAIRMPFERRRDAEMALRAIQAFTAGEVLEMGTEAVYKLMAESLAW